MTLVEKIKREWYNCKLAFVMSIVSVALAFMCMGGIGILPNLLVVLFIGGFIYTWIMTVKFKLAVERDLLAYIKTLLDEMLIEKACPENMLLVRNKGQKFSFTFHLNNYVTKEDIAQIVKRCQNELGIEIAYVTTK